MATIKKLSIIPLFIAPAIFTNGQSEDMKSSLLWKISGNGLTSSSYLFGTIHALPQDRLFLPDSTEILLSECNKLVLEVDMDNPEMMTEFQHGMVMTDTTLEELLSPIDYETVSKFFLDSLDIPIETVSTVKPLLLSSYILPKIIGQSPASYEETFVHMAQNLGKEVVGLETVSEQISYIDKVPLSRQAKMLVEEIVNFKESKLEYGALLAAYEKQNVDDIYTHMLESSHDFKNLEELLLKQRNRVWVARISKLAEDSSCFFAVGSGHLGGGEGLVALLRNVGYTVTPVI